MPVTPFHMGPAVLVDTVVDRWFSLGAFAVVQVAIDLEAAWNMAAGNSRVHTNLHTFLGATLLALVLIVPCRVVLDRLSRAVRERLTQRTDVLRRFVPIFRPVTWTGTIVGCVLGAASHVILDAVIHADAHPFAPWTDANPFLVSGSFESVHLLCLVVGFVTLPAWAWLKLRAGQSVA